MTIAIATDEFSKKQDIFVYQKANTPHTTLNVKLKQGQKVVHKNVS